MATIKTPVRAEYTGSDVTGLSEYQTNEVISVENVGTGVEAVSTNAILTGSSTTSLTQVVLAEKYLLLGGSGSTLEATNVIDCGRVA